MNPAQICRTLTLVGLLAVAGCGDDGGGSSASNVGTLAYVVTSCREVAGVATLHQELRILRGETETVTVMSVGPLGPFTSYGLCTVWGRARDTLAPRLGAFQRLGMAPDGSGVVFELSDASAQVGRDLLPPEQRGMYYVRADGSGRRRLGPASRVPAWYFVPPGGYWMNLRFGFDASGRQVTYPDLGPDEAGEEAPQVFVHTLATRERRQLTYLPRIAHEGDPPDIGWPSFIDAHTILFGRFSGQPNRVTYRTVDVDDRRVSDVPTVALPGGTLIPIFHIIGGQWTAGSFDVPSEAVNPVAGWLMTAEVFVTDGTNVLQLTDFHRTDTTTWDPFVSPLDGRVYFTASADPLGTNPSYDCQIFSIEPLTRDLRQVTFFHEGGEHWAACFSNRRPDGCRIDFNLASQNPVTGAIYFRSSCDPLGRNPNGAQLFAIQPDGTGLRQLTNARGFVQGEDRTVDVETVDFLWRSGPYR